MEYNKLQKLSKLLNEFINECPEDYFEAKSIEDVLKEIEQCAKLQEYKMMVDYMDQELRFHNEGFPSVTDFMSADFTLSFGLKTISICNNADVFDSIRQILLNEIDAIERGL